VSLLVFRSELGDLGKKLVVLENMLVA
jgi:hypothetical protein